MSYNTPATEFILPTHNVLITISQDSDAYNSTQHAQD